MAASTNPTSSYKTFLMYKATSGASYSKLIAIKSYPDLGGAPEQLDASDLESKFKHYVQGIQDNGTMDFLANYTKANYEAVKALDDGGTTSYAFAIWMGGTESNGTLTPTGDDGKFAFDATVSVYVNGKNVNEVREMTITLSLQSDITES